MKKLKTKTRPEKTKADQKMVVLDGNSAHEIAESIRRLRETNSLLIDLLDETLSANAKLVKVLQEAYPYITMQDKAKNVLDAILGVYKKPSNDGQPSE